MRFILSKRMLKYFSTRLKRTWADTFIFMGWDLKVAPIVRSVLLFITTYYLIYKFQTNIFGEKIEDVILPFMGFAIVFLCVLVINFFVSPIKIFNEQEKMILELSSKEKSKGELNRIADELSNFQQQGKDILKSFEGKTFSNYGSLVSNKEDWLSNLTLKMRTMGLSESDIAAVTTHPTSEKPQDELSRSLHALHYFIINLKQ